MTGDSNIQLAATAVVLRDTGGGLEVLLLRRHEQMRLGAGHWVFPGGSVDPEDFRDADGNRMRAFQLAAIRESQEEAALRLAEEGLQLMAYWTTPAHMRRRYATAFFLCDGAGQSVCVDGEEMDAHQWGSPADFICAHRAGELALMPPTLVTLSELAHCSTVGQAQQFYADRDVPDIHPRLTEHHGAVCMLYTGDAGYDQENPAAAGARNRCYLEEGVWRYEFLAP
ncbi:NUDIX domain-containing protein [Spongiibacter sp.]|uniref:NUDIX hydrolase n=1 Tax=Spongiibacter sp. TaxID=2024860 RepID=UPI0035660AF6